MPGHRLRVFISSPGDVGLEREICGRVVERLQGKFGSHFALESVRWEHDPARANRGSFQPQIVPPSQTMFFSSALRVGWISARQAPLAASRWVFSGQTHCAERFRVSFMQGSETTGAGAGSGAGGGGSACDGFATQ